MRTEEHQAFADRLGVSVDSIRCVDVLSESLHEGLLEGMDALVIGGAGEYSVVDPDAPIKSLIDFVGLVGERGFPTFASCFGFQCLVVALGGEVIHDSEGSEVGSTWVDLSPQGAADPLFGRLPSRFIAQQGHKDRASRLPAEAVCLAHNEAVPFQAIRLQGKPVFATQFHPELTGATNRQRFERYIAHYGEVFGAQRARQMLQEFVPSPEASGLLAGFSDFLRKQRGLET
ncbi:MAG: type 1 glutamine amidotransferase [Myxococcota bacterium]|nr:type 1 glutamine amidotransferase [Myxococcota bacterium]